MQMLQELVKLGIICITPNPFDNDNIVVLTDDNVSSITEEQVIYLLTQKEIELSSFFIHLILYEIGNKLSKKELDVFLLTLKMLVPSHHVGEVTEFIKTRPTW